jgi:hypothetical protein
MDDESIVHYPLSIINCCTGRVRLSSNAVQVGFSNGPLRQIEQVRMRFAATILPGT